MIDWIKQKWFLLVIGMLVASRLLHFEPWMDTFYAQRQADAAQYALDFYENGIDLFYPKVCWLGNHKNLILEFPLHEAMTALLYHAFGFNHVWSRLVTFLFYLLGTLYFYLILSKLLDKKHAEVGTIVYLLLPLGQVFSRSIHADFAAISLAHMAVYYVIRCIDDTPRPLTLLLFISAATLSALIKIPYLFYFAIPLAAYLITHWNTRTAITLGVAAVIPAILFLAWRNHVFTINEQAPDWFWIPGYYKFTHMNSWYFGALEMRFDAANWWTLLRRLATDIATPIGLLFFTLGITRKCRNRLFMHLWLVGTLFYVLIFFRLNVIHHYYQNPLISIVAVFTAIGLIHTAPRWKHLLPAALATIGAFAFCWAERHYYHRNYYAEEIGLRIQEHSDKNDLVVLAYPSTDWCDPRMLYAARRNGWALRPSTLTLENLQEYIDAGAKTLAVFKQAPLSPELQEWLAPSLKGSYDIKWDKQALDVYEFD